MGILRLWLAVLVVTWHVGPLASAFHMYDSNYAVIQFFMISGFYMQMISSKYGQGLHSWGDFYKSRILKLYPAYYVVFFLTLLTPVFFGFRFSEFQLISYWPDYFSVLQWPARVILIFSNLFIVGQELTFLFSIGETGKEFLFKPMEGVPPWMFLLVGQAWSISLELIFYALVPVMRKFRVKIVFLVASYITSLWISYYYPEIFRSGPHRFFPAALRFFLLGMLSYNLYECVFIKRNMCIAPKYLVAWSVVLYGLQALLIPVNLDVSNLVFALILPALFHATRHLK